MSIHRHAVQRPSRGEGFVASQAVGDAREHHAQLLGLKRAKDPPYGISAGFSGPHQPLQPPRHPQLGLQRMEAPPAGGKEHKDAHPDGRHGNLRPEPGLSQGAQLCAEAEDLLYVAAESGHHLPLPPLLSPARCFSFKKPSRHDWESCSVSLWASRYASTHERTERSHEGGM